MKLISNAINSSKLNFLDGNLSGNGSDYTPPSQIVVLPKSPITGRDGRTFTYDTEEVLNSFIENEAELPIDIEHATELKAPKGEYSGAFGWIKSLQAGKGGEIIANVKWKGMGCFDLADETYKYYSPAFEVDEDNKVTRLTSVGLTNRPNFKVPALNSEKSNSINIIKGESKLNKLTKAINARKARNAEDPTHEETIDEIKDIVDLPDNASTNDVIEEVAKIADKVDELEEKEKVSTNAEGDVPASILSALDLPENSSIQEVIDAINELKGTDNSGTETNSSKKKTVALQSELSKLSKELNSIKQEQFKERKNKAINSAINNGKISPATKRAFELSLNSIEAVKAFEEEMDKCPSLFKSNIKKPSDNALNSTSLNSEQREWCKKNKVEEKDFIKSQNNILDN